ncbi:MAG: glycosyltransferase family 4 protein [Henriciella sp.]|nr:glycosyltransferase family 4 protein [Henriciella sp.]
MRLLGLSEHFLPRVGGTVNYVHETCTALAALGHEVNLLVPNQQKDQVDLSALPYEVTFIDADYPDSGDPSRVSRYAFCTAANAVVQAAAERGNTDFVHVFFGLFLMETLETAKLKAAGIPCGATVHNLPPMECSTSWEGDAILRRLKDKLRVSAVAWKNQSRLKRHAYDLYVTPSDQVSEALARVRPGDNIQTLPHGVFSDLLDRMSPPSSRRPAPGTPVQLLTMGGWVPHKRQHLIPEVAHLLQTAGLDFRWRVAGPAARISGYKDAIDSDLAARGLQDIVITSGSVPFSELPNLYDAANLYIQPSTEEGFCMTALDAAAAGLPVIGSPAGALPDITTISNGRLVDSDPSALADAIIDFVTRDLWAQSTQDQINTVRQHYSWSGTASDLMAHMHRLV